MYGINNKFKCCGETFVTVIIKRKVACIMTEKDYNRIIETKKKSEKETDIEWHKVMNGLFCLEDYMLLIFSVFDVLNFVIAVLAVGISMISLYKLHMSGRPYINLIDMFFEPSEFHCYSLENLAGHEKLTEKHKEIINKTLGKICLTVIGGQKYLLVNMVNEDPNFNDIRLILSPYQYTYINTGDFVSEIQLVKGTFKLKEKDAFEKDIECKIEPEVEHEKINIRVAYVCEEGFYTSVRYNRLLEEKQRFSYSTDVDRARNIINFEKEEFIIKCKNNAKNTYKIKITYIWDNNELKFVVK